MSTLFRRERFGTPQVLAGLLLLVFIGQCIWLIAHQPVGAIFPDDIARVQEGCAQWHGHGVAGTPTESVNPDELPGMRGAVYDPDHSPLWYLIESAPVSLFNLSTGSRAWLWLTRLPFVLIGALLGASLWYVSRRLYGNAGGYTALILYCFSPAVIQSSTLWLSPPNIVTAWGTFGAVFTAIAVSHTLYAPREVVLWNWRRILLLGVSLVLAVGTHFSMVLIVPVLLGLMLYLAPHRVGAVIGILATACGVALALLFASYFFHPRLLAHGLANAALFPGRGASLAMWGAYAQVGREITAGGPVLVLLGPACLVAWCTRRRSRYFGNTAPLLAALLFLALRLLSPHQSGEVYGLLVPVFVCVFAGGVVADLLENKGRELTIAIVAGSLGAHVLWSLFGLFRLRG